ncbi:Light-independent protochlorophyllide reductase subunit N [Dissostichus eleginoides]|uniref:Light-independent protochlorophyllide reductase subunit N n=1 Tax=Dissostichus eleginoides TaxID=100907 RepID=A0AAD9CK34_DISEL|nr:Light-independent protochlorophyllide reductase subunit N [Dissostichus eleginoides]
MMDGGRGSIIWLAVWVPVSCLPGDPQAMGAGRHWAEASPASAAAVWETERGAAQMWESGANRRHLNRHETHFQWDTNPLPLSQQRAVLQCQPGAHSTGISFLREHRQAFRVS